MSYPRFPHASAIGRGLVRGIPHLPLSMSRWEMRSGVCISAEVGGRS